jgi:hypothetical protein
MNFTPKPTGAPYFPPPNVIARVDLTVLPELLLGDSVLLETAA